MRLTTSQAGAVAAFFTALPAAAYVARLMKEKGAYNAAGAAAGAARHAAALSVAPWCGAHSSAQ